MSDKRFNILPNNVVWDNQLGVVVCRCILEGIGDAENVCQRLNEQQTTISRLEEENEKLRQFINKGRRLSVKELMDSTNENELLKKKIRGFEKENEQLKEQLQMIKRVIQTQITEKEEDLRTSVKGGMPTGGLYSEIGLLEKLKKECFDE